MSPGLKRHTQHPWPGAVACFVFNSALVFPESASVQIWLQKSLLVGNEGGKMLRRLSSALFGVSLGAVAGSREVMMRSERGWQVGTAAFVILLYVRKYDAVGINFDLRCFC